MVIEVDRSIIDQGASGVSGDGGIYLKKTAAIHRNVFVDHHDVRYVSTVKRKRPGDSDGRIDGSRCLRLKGSARFHGNETCLHRKGMGDGYRVSVLNKGIVARYGNNATDPGARHVPVTRLRRFNGRILETQRNLPISGRVEQNIVPTVQRACGKIGRQCRGVVVHDDDLVARRGLEAADILHVQRRVRNRRSARGRVDLAENRQTFHVHVHRCIVQRQIVVVEHVDRTGLRQIQRTPQRIVATEEAHARVDVKRTSVGECRVQIEVVHRSIDRTAALVGQRNRKAATRAVERAAAGVDERMPLKATGEVEGAVVGERMVDPRFFDGEAQIEGAVVDRRPQIYAVESVVAEGRNRTIVHKRNVRRHPAPMNEGGCRRTSGGQRDRRVRVGDVRTRKLYPGAGEGKVRGGNCPVEGHLTRPVQRAAVQVQIARVEAYVCRTGRGIVDGERTVVGQPTGEEEGSRKFQHHTTAALVGHGGGNGLRTRSPRFDDLSAAGVDDGRSVVDVELQVERSVVGERLVEARDVVADGQVERSVVHHVRRGEAVVAVVTRIDYRAVVDQRDVVGQHRTRPKF